MYILIIKRLYNTLMLFWGCFFLFFFVLVLAIILTCTGRPHLSLRCEVTDSHVYGAILETYTPQGGPTSHSGGRVQTVMSMGPSLNHTFIFIYCQLYIYCILYVSETNKSINQILLTCNGVATVYGVVIVGCDYGVFTV